MAPQIEIIFDFIEDAQNKANEFLAKLHYSEVIDIKHKIVIEGYDVNVYKLSICIMYKK